MPIAVITPISEEFNALSRALEQHWQDRDVRQVGRVQAHAYRCGEVILAQGGLGKVQFAVTTQHVLDNLHNPTFMVCAGVAGSLTRDVTVGDVVIGTTTVEHDFNSKQPDARLPRFDGSGQTPCRPPKGIHHRPASFPRALRTHCQRRRGDCGRCPRPRAESLDRRSGGRLGGVPEEQGPRPFPKYPTSRSGASPTRLTTTP